MIIVLCSLLKVVLLSNKCAIIVDCHFLQAIEVCDSLAHSIDAFLIQLQCCYRFHVLSRDLLSLYLSLCLCLFYFRGKCNRHYGHPSYRRNRRCVDDSNSHHRHPRRFCHHLHHCLCLFLYPFLSSFWISSPYHYSSHMRVWR